MPGETKQMKLVSAKLSISRIFGDNSFLDIITFPVLLSSARKSNRWSLMV